MGLQIATRKSGDVVILDLSGRAVIGQSNEALNTELRKQIAAGAQKVLVNLASVTQMDSSGISTLVRTFVSLERGGGSLRLLGPRGHVRAVLELTRLIQSIPTFDVEAEAIASFGQAARAK
ncbi:MAG: STAS domain-containing protein [Candidatus Acidiferrales bacterium]